MIVVFDIIVNSESGARWRETWRKFPQLDILKNYVRRSVVYWRLIKQSEILKTGRTCENKWKQSGGWLKIVGVMKLYKQIPMWGYQSVGVSGNLKSEYQLEARRAGNLGDHSAVGRCPGGPPVESPRAEKKKKGQVGPWR